MTNREIIERLRKRIEEILRQYDPPGSRKPHASTARSGAEAGGGYGGYPEVQTQTAGRDGFRVYTSVYAAGANQWLQPTPIDAILLLAGSEESRLAPDSLALFLDIETTGLSGAGTVAFLVGLGRWETKDSRSPSFSWKTDSEPIRLRVGAQIGSAQVRPSTASCRTYPCAKPGPSSTVCPVLRQDLSPGSTLTFTPP